jgi:hypothetical protein
VTTSEARCCAWVVPQGAFHKQRPTLRWKLGRKVLGRVACRRSFTVVSSGSKLMLSISLTSIHSRLPVPAVMRLEPLVAHLRASTAELSPSETNRAVCVLNSLYIQHTSLNHTTSRSPGDHTHTTHSLIASAARIPKVHTTTPPAQHHTQLHAAA